MSDDYTETGRERRARGYQGTLTRAQRSRRRELTPAEARRNEAMMAALARIRMTGGGAPASPQPPTDPAPTQPSMRDGERDPVTGLPIVEVDPETGEPVRRGRS